MRSFVSLSVRVVMISVPAGALTRQEKVFLKGRFSRKILVVTKAGLAYGACQSYSGSMPRRVAMGVNISPSGDVTYQPSGGWRTLFGGCRNVLPAPIYAGEVIFSAGAHFEGDKLIIPARLLGEHRIDLLDEGMNEKTSETPYISGWTRLIFDLPPKISFPEAVKFLESWVQALAIARHKTRFARNRAHVDVPNLGLGMTFAEVENILGPPSARLELVELMAYVYDDFTVLFEVDDSSRLIRVSD